MLIGLQKKSRLPAPSQGRRRPKHLRGACFLLSLRRRFRLNRHPVPG